MKHFHALLLLALISAPSAFAQGKGFSLGVGLQSTNSTIDLGDFGGEEESESGFGLGITADYGFSNLISAFLTLDGSDIDGTQLGHADLGVRFHFRTQEMLSPYAQVALSAISATDEEEGNDISFTGGGLMLGGGVHYFFSPKLALDVSLGYTAGQFTKLEVDGDEVEGLDEIDTSSVRLRAGIMYFFSRR